MRPASVGILGCGFIAPQHIRAWRRDRRFALRGVFDLDPGAARRLASSAPDISVFESSDELISECAVVDVCTPPATHFQLIQSALDSSRHVVVEKPVVIDEVEWTKIRALLDEYQKSFSVVHHMKFTRAVETAKRLVDAGRIGRLLRIDSFFATHQQVDRMLTDAPHWSHSLPGGRWFETLPHNLYLAHHLAGPLEVEHVSALRTKTAPPGAPADEVSILLRGAQTMGTIQFSAHCRHNYRWANLLGTDGTLRLDLLSGALAFDRVDDRRMTRALGRLFLQAAAALTRAPIDRLAYLADRIARRTPHARFVEALGDHLFDGGPPPTPLEEIEFTVENTYAIGRAIDAQISGS